MYGFILFDQNGSEAGRYDYMDDNTGLVSVGGTENDHVPLSGLQPEQAYLYVSEGGMVLEDPNGTGQVQVDGYVIDQPTYIVPESFVQVGPYSLKLFAAAVPSCDAQAGEVGAAGGFSAGSGPSMPEEAAGGYYQGGAAQVALDLAYAPGGPALSQGPMRLMALSGLLAGKEFLLEKGQEYDVGRDQILEVFLEDPSISRRHARIRTEDGSIMVMDLRSTNGTFINGEKIKRQLALPGDRIRFGEIGFKLENILEDGKPKEKATSAFNPRKLVMIAGGTLGLLMVVVLTVALIKRSSRKKRPRTVSAQMSLAAKQRRRFKDLMAQGQVHMKKQQWNDALRSFEEALEDYPSADSKKQAEEHAHLAKTEIDAEKNLKDANRFYSIGGNMENYNKAKELYRKIPLDSYYSVESKDKIEKINLRIARQYLAEGKAYNKGRRVSSLLKAHMYLCDYFKIIGEIPRPVVEENSHRKDLKHLESDLRKKKGFVPCNAPRFLSPLALGTTTAAVDIAGLIRKKYKVEPIVEVMLIYYKGAIDGALKRLMKVKEKKNMQAHKMLASDIHNKLALIKGKVAEAYSALEAKDIPKADKAFSAAFKWEEQILPPTVKSSTRIDASKRMGEQYFELGQEQYQMGRYSAAFRHWKRGMTFDSSHTGILNGLVQLEKHAHKLLQQAKSFGPAQKAHAVKLYQMVMEMTESKSQTHKEAAKGLAQLQGK